MLGSDRLSRYVIPTCKTVHPSHCPLVANWWHKKCCTKDQSSFVEGEIICWIVNNFTHKMEPSASSSHHRLRINLVFSDNIPRLFHRVIISRFAFLYNTKDPLVSPFFSTLMAMCIFSMFSNIIFCVFVSDILHVPYYLYHPPNKWLRLAHHNCGY